MENLMTGVIRNIDPNPPGEDFGDDEMDTGEGTDRDNGNAESEGMGEDESADESAG